MRSNHWDKAHSDILIIISVVERSKEYLKGIIDTTFFPHSFNETAWEKPL